MVSAKSRLTIKDLPKVKQPRERLKELGLSNLTEKELLAIVLGTGTKGTHVLNLAKNILSTFPLKKLGQINQQELSRISGIGEIQAGKILAALELGKRAAEDSPLSTLDNLADVLKQIHFITVKNQEHLLALFLNARHQLIHQQVISIGSLNQAIIEPKEVFSQALILPSSFIILAHNHPSNDPTPSQADLKFTKKIIEAGELLGIEILDHIIITPKKYFSFYEEKLL